MQKHLARISHKPLGNLETSVFPRFPSILAGRVFKTFQENRLRYSGKQMFQIFPKSCKKYGLGLKVILLLSTFLCQGCDIRGANDPFSYAPSSPHSIWAPPERALRRLSHEALALAFEDDDFPNHDAPLSLAEVINITLYRNPETKQSWADARIAAAEYGQSLQNDFLLADVQGDYSRARSAEFLSRDREIIYETQYGAHLELNYLLFDFGQTRMTSEAALQALYNADWLHNSEVQQKIQTLMTTYYDYLYQKKLLIAIKQDVINAQVALNATEEKLRCGLADVSDVVQAKNKLPTAKTKRCQSKASRS